jgi:hypothetical protein
VLQGHFCPAYRSYFALRDFFLQDDLLVPVLLPAMSLWVVVRFMRLVLRYRCQSAGVAADLLLGEPLFLILEPRRVRTDPDSFLIEQQFKKNIGVEKKHSYSRHLDAACWSSTEVMFLSICESPPAQDRLNFFLAGLFFRFTSSSI